MFPVLINVLALATGFIALGAAFDRLLMTPNAKQRLLDYIKHQPVEDNRTVAIKLFQLGVDAVFNRVLRYRWLSFPYFVNCILISAASLAIIIALQLMLFGIPSLDGFKWSWAQIGIILLCILANFLVDYVSIAQTHAFFVIAKEQKTLGRMVLIVASDFVLTINVFILMYSQFLSFVVMWFATTPIKANLIATTYSIEQLKLEDDENKDLWESAGRPVYQYSFGLDGQAGVGSEFVG